jgi:hypothetical protein
MTVFAQTVINKYTTTPGFLEKPPVLAQLPCGFPADTVPIPIQTIQHVD